MIRDGLFRHCGTLLAVVCALLCAHGSARADTAFATWLQSLWPQAQELGISRTTFDTATRGLEPDLTLPDLVLPGRVERPSAGQPEFVMTPADYLKEPAIERLAGDARRIYERYRAPLDTIERQFGVPPEILLAIFGRETDFGRSTDSRNAIRVLATQAYLGRRKEQFLTEFLLAMKILDQGGIKLAEMRSSWAGAMGLTQFLPSDYLKYAVDFDGNGHADIWHSVPDALASAAKQLVGKGWQPRLRRPMSIAPSACRATRSPLATGSRAASSRPMAAYYPPLNAPRPRRWCSPRVSTVRRFSPLKIILPSRNITFPISTCCSSGT
jgi:lytic murein transglycosylase